MSDLTRVIAFAFRRKGLVEMPLRDLRMMLAFDLNWFAPADAKRAVERALEAGLIIGHGETARIAFDPASVEVPLAFAPHVSLLDAPLPAVPTTPPPAADAASAAAQPPGNHEEAAPTEAPATAAAATTAAPAHDAEAVEAERRRHGELMSKEIATLILARRRGEDITARVAEEEARLLASTSQRGNAPAPAKGT